MPNLFGANQGGNTTTVEEETQEVVDLSAYLDEEIVADRPDADINALIPQPPAGIYVLSVGLQDKGEVDNPRLSLTTDKKPFVVANLDLKIVDEGSEFHDCGIFNIGVNSAGTAINSLVQKARQTSPIHHFMNCVGQVLPQHIKVRDLLQIVRETLEPRVLVQAEVEWKASRKAGPGKFEWEIVAQRMRDFPKNLEGDGYSQTFIYKDKKSGEITECRATAYVKAFLVQA